MVRSRRGLKSDQRDIYTHQSRTLLESGRKSCERSRRKQRRSDENTVKGMREGYGMLGLSVSGVIGAVKRSELRCRFSEFSKVEALLVLDTATHALP